MKEDFTQEIINVHKNMEVNIYNFFHKEKKNFKIRGTCMNSQSWNMNIFTYPYLEIIPKFSSKFKKKKIIIFIPLCFSEKKKRGALVFETSYWLLKRVHCPISNLSWNNWSGNYPLKSKLLLIVTIKGFFFWLYNI